MPDKLLRTVKEKVNSRKRKISDRDDPVRFVGQTNLEKMAVSAVVGRDYFKRMTDFRSFVKLKKLKLAPPMSRLDTAFCWYLNSLFEQGLEYGEGSKCLAAVIDSFPGCGPRHQLPRSRRALQGWQKQDPQRTRPPLPWSLVASMVMSMLERNMVHHAAMIMLMFSAYVRPGEAYNLQKVDLVAPMPGHQWFSLHLHPAERQETSKVGLSDESLFLDATYIPWLGKALATLDSPDQFLFNVQYTSLVSVWKQALLHLGLPTSHAILYQLRHSGPSHDRLHRLRSALAVKQRGRWMADSSVIRHETHARVHAEFHHLPKKVQNKCLLDEKRLEKEGPRFFGLKA